MLRIDPASPPVWRSADTLQFGAVPRVVLDDPPPWQLRLIAELERGVPEAAVDALAMALGAAEGEAAQLMSRIASALEPERLRPHVCVRIGPGVAGETADILSDVLRERGADVVDDDTDAQTVTIVVVAHTVAPRDVADLMSRDRRHLPIVLHGSSADVGPLVVPGRTPCTTCLDLTRTDRDAAWPAIATQLAGRPLVIEDAERVRDCARAALDVIIAAEDAGPREAISLHLRHGSGSRRVSVHRPHGACRCRSLAESETAAVHAFPAPMSATAFARPA